MPFYLQVDPGGSFEEERCSCLCVVDVLVCSFLGSVDLYGTTFEDNLVATGFGTYMAIPLLRKNWRADLTEEEARKLLTDCMRVLYYRDARTINKVRV
jgi:20S proteasome subunit beta 7